MPDRKRHVRQAVIENLSAGDTDIPQEAIEAWKAIKYYVSGYDREASVPTKAQCQILYELVLGYQVFIRGAYRIASRPVGQDELNPEPYSPPLVVLR